MRLPQRRPRRPGRRCVRSVPRAVTPRYVEFWLIRRWHFRAVPMPRRINFGSRLTLNVLLSFAQFEREVTSERIRDEISASKRKGLWVGGLPSAAARRSKPRRRFIARVEIEREQVVIKLADPSGNQSHDGSATSFFVCRSKSQTRLADAR